MIWVDKDPAAITDAERLRRALVSGAEVERLRAAWARMGDGRDGQGCSKADLAHDFLADIPRWLTWLGPRGVRWALTEDRHLDATRPDGVTSRYSLAADFDEDVRAVCPPEMLEAGLDVMVRARDAAEAERRHAAGEDGWARVLGVIE